MKVWQILKIEKQWILVELLKNMVENMHILLFEIITSFERGNIPE